VCGLENTLLSPIEYADSDTSNTDLVFSHARWRGNSGVAVLKL